MRLSDHLFLDHDPRQHGLLRKGDQNPIVTRSWEMAHQKNAADHASIKACSDSNDRGASNDRGEYDPPGDACRAAEADCRNALSVSNPIDSEKATQHAAIGSWASAGPQSQT
jgi:hypothetical protein